MAASVMAIPAGSIPAGVPQPKAGKDGVFSAASVHAAAVLRNYHLNPRLDYGASSTGRCARRLRRCSRHRRHPGRPPLFSRALLPLLSHPPSLPPSLPPSASPTLPA